MPGIIVKYVKNYQPLLQVGNGRSQTLWLPFILPQEVTPHPLGHRDLMRRCYKTLLFLPSVRLLSPDDTRLNFLVWNFPPVPTKACQSQKGSEAFLWGTAIMLYMALSFLLSFMPSVLKEAPLCVFKERLSLSLKGSLCFHCYDVLTLLMLARVSPTSMTGHVAVIMRLHHLLQLIRKGNFTTAPFKTNQPAASGQQAALCYK